MHHRWDSKILESGWWKISLSACLIRQGGGRLQKAVCASMRPPGSPGSWSNFHGMVMELLVGGLEPWNFMTFHILGRIIPTDFYIFQRGIPPTSIYMGCSATIGKISSELQFFDAHPKEMHSTHLASVQSRNDLSNFVIRSLIF